TERRRRSTVHPVRVVDADQERRLERGALEERLEVPEEPEPLFRLRPRVRELTAIEQGFRPLEQRRQESGKLHHALARLGGGRADPETKAASDAGDLGEQATLSHPGAAPEENDPSGPLGDPRELALDDRELRFAPVEPLTPHRRHRRASISTPCVNPKPWRASHGVSNDGFV